MRRTQTDFSTKHKKYRRETQNMITTAQANMSSSNSLWQLSTVRNRTMNNRTQTSMKGAQTFNEQILQELNSVFLNNEQGMVIRQIIELTRKGKINQNNSFEFPIKVIDPKCTERITVEFWKLASEILGSSTNIYDKRVDNFSITSNKIMGQLLRIKDNTVTIQQSTSKLYTKQKSDQRSTKLNLSAESLKISINEIQFSHTQPAQKINFNQMKKDFFKDTLLLNSKGIEYSSTSGLMLNVLEIGSDLRLELHRKQGSLDDDCYIQEQIKDGLHLFNKYIGQNFHLLSQPFHLKSFDQIGKYKDKHIVNRVNEESFQQMLQSIIMSNQESQARLQPLNINPQQSDPSQFQNNSFLSVETRSHISGFKESKISTQSRDLFQRSINTNLQNKKESLMIAGPWEMQFKQLKLQKMNKSKNISKQSKKRVSQDEYQIRFSIDFPEFKNDIINKKRIKSQRILQSIIYEDKNLLPKTINPHIQIEKRRRLRQRVQKQTQNQETKKRQRQQTLVDKQSAFLKAQFIDNISSHQDCENGFYKTKETKIQQQQNIDNLCYEQIRSMNTFGAKNIGQIKQLIYMHLMRQSSLKISQVQCGLSPAGMLIVFLHLVNQKNLQIQSLDNENDTKLFIPL